MGKKLDEIMQEIKEKDPELYNEIDTESAQEIEEMRSTK